MFGTRRTAGFGQRGTKDGQQPKEKLSVGFSLRIDGELPPIANGDEIRVEAEHAPSTRQKAKRRRRKKSEAAHVKLAAMHAARAARTHCISLFLCWHHDFLLASGFWALGAGRCCVYIGGREMGGGGNTQYFVPQPEPGEAVATALFTRKVVEVASGVGGIA